MFNIRVYGILMRADRSILVSDELIRDGQYTKFCGGGLELGEGTRDCLVREFKEEMNLSVSVQDHLYTTDYYQVSGFNPKHQLISIYYWVEALEDIRVPLTVSPFEFSDEQRAKHAQTGQAETFRFIPWEQFGPDCMSLPVDKIAARMVKNHRF